MCGFVGVASTEAVTEVSWLARSRSTLKHRGPDDAGEWWSMDRRVGLAHQRLSIFDLSPAGHQPMRLEGNRLTAVYNGEIYNFKELRTELKSFGHAFRSESDTEVLLAAYAEWGSSCVHRFNGMFAFAIHDEPNALVFLARDRSGEKPLFYLRNGSELLFASELKAILARPSVLRSIDSDALDCFLSMGFVPGDRCILKGYKKLPPAHSLTFNLRTGSILERRYWQPPDAGAVSDVSRAEGLLGDFESLFEDAVGLQMAADVPVGVLLSGGVDSSLVTAMAVRRSSKVQTFCIGFPGSGHYDETSHAKLVADYFGTKHTVLAAEPTTADLLPRLASFVDEPIIDSSLLPTWLVSRLISAHCKVALGGDGGDELFGGYGHHARLMKMREIHKWIPSSLRRSMSSMASTLLPTGFWGRQWLQAGAVDLNGGLPLIASYFDPRARASLLGERFANTRPAEKIFSQRVPSDPDLVQRMTRMDYQNYLPEDILVKVDRASMANSLEVRAPFLDYRIVEFAFSRVPSALKVTSADKKIFLKEFARRVLPPTFDIKRKQGFSIPLTDWLKKGPFHELFWDTLTTRDCMFHGPTINRLLRDQERGIVNNSERLFGLVFFELWRKQYGVS